MYDYELRSIINVCVDVIVTSANARVVDVLAALYIHVHLTDMRTPIFVCLYLVVSSFSTLWAFWSYVKYFVHNVYYVVALWMVKYLIVTINYCIVQV